MCVIIKKNRRNCIGLYKANRGKNGIIGKEWKTKRQMKPLLAGKRRNYCKYTYVDSSDVSHCYKTKAMKLELKNANRAIKKADRHKAKLEIQKSINHLNN